MTNSAHPPFWAEPALRAVLPRDRAEDVTGDLLEILRGDTALRGSPFRQSVWYLRHVVGYFLRAYWFFPAALGGMLVLNDALNTFRDVAGARSGPDLLGPAVTTIFLFASLYGGSRTSRVAGGVVAAVGTHIVAWTVMMLWFLATTYPFALVQERNPYWLNAWRSSAARDESFMHWIVWDNIGAVMLGGTVLLVLAIGIGLAGGVASSGLRPTSHARA
jgi:hypothetical protein